MQTTKSRPGTLDVPRKTSPATPRTGRMLKTPGSDSDSLSSPSPVRKTPKDRSPNIVDRRSPRSPAIEAHLQDELKKAKDQLSSSESFKKKAQQEADEAKCQLTAILAELKKTQEQLNELSDSEDARIQELRKISHDRDKEWQSELEAVQKQHLMDSAALAFALNEIHSLRVELTETHELVGKLKSQLSDSRESEVWALERETLKLENGNVMGMYESLIVELEESKSKANSLEGLVSKFQADFANASKIPAYPSNVVEAGHGECDQSMKTEINTLENEASQLRDALKDANEFVMRAKMESCEREAELEMKLKESRAEFEELDTKLIEKYILQKKSCERETEFRNELKKPESVLEKEMRAQSIMEENKTLKSEILKKETEKSEEKREALLKLGNLTEEADRSSKKSERLTEQLNAAQAASSEMEAELRRLKVQSDQWRKATEAAAAMLLTENNGKYVEKMGNLDYQMISGKPPGSPFSNDESAVKKNGNVLKKIGVLLKKGQK